MSQSNHLQGNEGDGFLDGLELDLPPRGATRAAAPAPPSAPARTPRARWLELGGMALASAVLTAAIVLLCVGFSTSKPSEPGTTDAVALGRTFVAKLADALAQGFDAGAEAIAQGKSMGDGNAILKTTFTTARARAFEQHAGKAIRDLVPDGQDFPDDDTRKAMTSLFQGFAKGLREAR